MIFSTFVAMAVAHITGAPTLPRFGKVAALLSGAFHLFSAKDQWPLNNNDDNHRSLPPRRFTSIVKNLPELPLPLKHADYASGCGGSSCLIAATMIGIAGVPGQSGGNRKNKHGK
ncbi:MAG: hypothetical protein IPJ18_20270 [Betaproteobacteria bacterium]|nr:hypothetical protein [Betaproteobacteria bacterium]